MDSPILDARTVSDAHGVSTEAARNALGRLAERGILVERPLRSGRRGRPARVFEAAELFSLLDADPRMLAASQQRD